MADYANFVQLLLLGLTDLSVAIMKFAVTLNLTLAANESQTIMCYTIKSSIYYKQYHVRTLRSAGRESGERSMAD